MGSMRKKSDLRGYQNRVVTHLYENDAVQVIVGMGGGKTVTALTAIRELIDDGVIRCALLLAPKRVVQLVWPAEPPQWEHLDGMKLKTIVGTPAQRERALLAGDAEVYLLGIDNIPWLVKLLETLPADHPLFDLLIIDELSKLKSPTGAWVKALRGISRGRSKRGVIENFQNIWGLTGTPRPNGWQDQFAPIKLLSKGKAWPQDRGFDRWRKRRFMQMDYEGHDWEVRPEWVPEILREIQKYSITISEAEMPDLPPMSSLFHWVDLPPAAGVEYKKMERELLAEHPEGDVMALNAAISSGKLAQAADGFMYDTVGGVREVRQFHAEKRDQLAEIIDQLGQEAALIAYGFQESLAAMRDLIPGLPWLGQGTSDKQAAAYEKGWNDGSIQHLALHPACLHPDTLVLTEHRGWSRVVDVRDTERVFDGVGFVSHGGCRLAGVKPVTDLCGIELTPDHLVLVNGEWMEARHVRSSAGLTEAARYRYEGDDARLGAMFGLRHGARDPGAERPEGEPAAEGPLPVVRVSQDDERPPMENMETHAGEVRKPERSELRALRRERNRSGVRMAKLSALLARHAGRLLRRLGYRTGRRERALLQSELPVGVEHGAASQQAHEPCGLVQRRADASGRVLQASGRHQRGDNTISEPVRDRRRSDGGVCPVDVPSASGVAVYDLVNCGPRRRFVVRAPTGEAFIVHNSAGHGLNLQHGGRRLIVYGMPWSAELYDQMVKRFWRPGQDRHCFVHHILARGTVDEVKYDRVIGKMSAQDAFKKYIKEI